MLRCSSAVAIPSHIYHILFSVRPQWSKLYTHVCTYGLPTFWLESDQVFIVDWLAKQTNRKASEIRNVTMLKASIWRGMHLRVVIDPTLLIGPRNYHGIIVMVTVSTKRPSSRMWWTCLHLVPRAPHPCLLPRAARASCLVLRSAAPYASHPDSRSAQLRSDLRDVASSSVLASSSASTSAHWRAASRWIHVATIYFVRFRYMLQMFHLDVANVDLVLHML
jgi:hypothetical protein